MFYSFFCIFCPKENLITMTGAFEKMTTKEDALRLLQLAKDTLNWAVGKLSLSNDSTSIDLTSILTACGKIVNHVLMIFDTNSPEITKTTVTNANESRDFIVNTLNTMAELLNSTTQPGLADVWSDLITRSSKTEIVAGQIVTQLATGMATLGLSTDLESACHVSFNTFNSTNMILGIIPAEDSNGSCSLNVSGDLDAGGSNGKSELVFRLTGNAVSQLSAPDAEVILPQKSIANILTGQGLNKTALFVTLLPSCFQNASTCSSVTGGIPVDRNNISQDVFTLSESSLTAALAADVPKVALNNASDLQILSHVLSVTVIPSEANRMQVDNSATWLNFSLPLGTMNVPHAVVYAKKTGRMPWAAAAANRVIASLEASMSLNLSVAQPVRCVFWNDTYYQMAPDSSSGAWDNNGCLTTGANLTHVNCSCSHLSLFAVAMQPVDQKDWLTDFWNVCGAADADTHALVMDMIFLVCNPVSLIATSAMIISLALRLWMEASGTLNWVRIPPQRYLVHIGLAVSLFIWHAGLLAALTAEKTVPDDPTSLAAPLFCQLAGFVVSLAGLFVTAWLACENFFLFQSLVRGYLTLKTLVLLFTVCLPPIILLATSTALSGLAQVFGQDLICLPARESLVLPLVEGGMLAYLTVGGLFSMILACNLETPAHLVPELVYDLK
ncbi:unnamed protein product [Protopolystoma xenopodis]|uniref:GAIN-B domain-containing protein n=1 Tax=Protopolystoma xenopodis TaxID=117903 RepID=A0A448XDT1_9PLAT|nr:unnamed protein product [Protopolystoma xenopodis]